MKGEMEKMEGGNKSNTDGGGWKNKLSIFEKAIEKQYIFYYYIIYYI